MVRKVKREPSSCSRSGRKRTETVEVEVQDANSDSGHDDITQRRLLRSSYLNLSNRIIDERDYLFRADSDKFKTMIDEVENLHLLVQKPREQVADAETLFDITSTLLTSVKAHSNTGVTPSDFVSCLLGDFEQQGGPGTGREDGRSSICWKDIGLAVSHVFMRSPGCCTMFGPMNTEIKQRKVVRRKRVGPTASAPPEELNQSAAEERTDTDKTIATMFDILRKYRRVRLESLILNRNSFAQTVENLFALSFLVKDGRVELTVDEKGSHLVSPRNAPAANAVASKEVSFNHFVFRFDFKDWTLMMTSVGVGEQLMPHRNDFNASISQLDAASGETQTTMPTTPIRKLSRNRGLVLQEQMVIDNSPESDDSASKTAAVRKGKRRHR